MNKVILASLALVRVRDCNLGDPRRLGRRARTGAARGREGAPDGAVPHLPEAAGLIARPIVPPRPTITALEPRTASPERTSSHPSRLALRSALPGFTTSSSNSAEVRCPDR